MGGRGVLVGLRVGVAVGGRGVLVGLRAGVAVDGRGVLVGLRVGVAVGGRGVLVGLRVGVAVAVSGVEAVEHPLKILANISMATIDKISHSQIGMCHLSSIGLPHFGQKFP